MFEIIKKYCDVLNEENLILVKSRVLTVTSSELKVCDLLGYFRRAYHNNRFVVNCANHGWRKE